MNGTKMQRQRQHPALVTLLDLRQASDNMDWLDGFENDSWQGFRADLSYRIRSLEEILQNLKETK